MAFSHVEDLELADVPPRAWQPANLPPGLELQILGNDPETGALTGVLSVPDGWSAGQVKSTSAFELYLLDGAIEIDGAILPPGHYCFRAGGDIMGTLASHGAARAIVRFHGTPEFLAAPGEKPLIAEASVPHLDTWTEPWVDPLTASEPSEDYRAGVMVKMLRCDPETGATTHLAGLMPGWFMPGQEVHPVFEENYCLSGDVHIADVAGAPGYTMLPGTYLARPPGIAHGPIASKNGNVNLIFAHGRLEIDYVTHPKADHLIRRHLEGFPWM